MDPTNQTAATPLVTTTTSGQLLSTSPSSVFLEPASPSPTVSREQLRINFYRTYDVMTGVRIAATLGGFFSLMVLLVVYKSKCKSKSISEEDLNAAVAAAERESAQLSSVLDPAAFYSLNLDAERGPRRSLGNMSAPVFIRATRFSIGGYSNLDSSPCFQHQRGKSLPGSALHFPFNPRHNNSDGDRGGISSSPSAGSCFQEVDAEQEEESVLASPCCYHKFLSVPTDSRRLSSITCSSSDTSYLERRGSAVELGLPAPPFFPHRGLRKGSEIDCAMPEESWDFYYPIDIQVIQPTPEMSPCGSERTLYDHTMERASSVSIAESASCLSVPKLAPLASIGSCAISLSDYPDLDTHSVGSDSVFMDDDQDLDTEDEVEGFSTDSEDETIARNEIRRHPRQTLGRSPTSDVPFSQHFLQVPMSRSLQPAGRWGAAAGYQPRRRVSAPSAHYGGKKSTCDTISAKVAAEDSKGTTSPPDLDLPSCSSRSGVTQRPPFPLPAEETNSTDSLTTSRAVFEGSDTGASPPGSASCDRLDQLSDPPRSQSLFALPSFPLIIRGSCEHLARALENRTPVSENCTWSQETLF